jgi:hypothetical protein
MLIIQHIMDLEDPLRCHQRLSILSVPAPISVHLSTNFLTYRPHIHTPDKSISSCRIPAFSYKISALKLLRLVLLSLLEALAQILSPMEYLYILQCLNGFKTGILRSAAQILSPIGSLQFILLSYLYTFRGFFPL